ncbi:MAG: UvrD-helicase domain-containing protein [Flavobacteriaceae bacterium]|nr:UvrD-helicase domain-containing protein [Flavobacteriaceae bacterium]
MQVTSQFQVYNASAGSGKTFTLVKEYLKILLSTDDIFRFQNILAITFTNKAAAEMKERVLNNLKEFSEGKANDMFAKISEEISTSDKVLQQRSKRVLNSILQNYSAFNITTIDAFTYRIIRNFSFDLGLSLNFEVEMDANSLLEEAVDLLISKIGFDKDLTKVLIDYSLEKADDDKSWDISHDLREFARVLLNENDIKQLKKLENKTVQDFTGLKKHLRKNNKIIENRFSEIGNKGLEIINSMNLEHNDFYRSMLPNHFKNLAQNFEKVKFFDESKLRERIEENTFYSKSKSEDIKTAIEEVLPQLLGLYSESEKLYQQYTQNNLVLKSLIPLAVLKHINFSLNEIKEQNNIRLNAEFNQLISDKIKDEPAPFIYERLGEKFRYYFIDEMQDTSQLQWQNLIPLIENALTSETIKGNKGNLMLVGDAKQAIYRWRGGKAEQFIDLTEKKNPFPVTKESKNLEINYRSYSEIIDFNNQFYSHISGFLTNEKYQKLYVNGNQQEKTAKKGGFVQISFVEKDKDDEEKELIFPKKVLNIIQNLDSNFALSDVCVLVRKKKEGFAVANYLSENDINIISSETLLLKNNKTVGFIIDLLTFLNNNEDREALANALYFLNKKIDIQENTHDFIAKLINKSSQEIFEILKGYGFIFNEVEFVSLPFYDSIEYVIRCFNLVSTPNAFVLEFLDFVLEYQQKRGSDLSGFLEFWEQKKESLCITTPEGQNAVKIMTIHKSKGLEFPVVIYPYDLDMYREIKPKVWLDNLDKTAFLNFETSLVDYSKKLNYTGKFGENLYNERREEIELDSLNLLYVATTRAVEQLYIVTEKKTKINDLENARFYSDLFVDFLKSQSNKNSWEADKSEYNFGNSERVLSEKKQKDTDDFISQEVFISSPWKNHDISIVANSSKLWDTDQGQAIKYGNLIHEVLSKVKTTEDVESVIQQYIFEGVLNSEEAKSIKEKVFEVVEHPLMKDYFETNVLVFNEQELISKDKKRQIPDRIVVKGNNVVVIDYKTGSQNKKHYLQVKEYSNTLNEMGYEVLEKLLVYIDSNLIVERVL